MEHAWWMWVGFIGIVGTLMALDLGVLNRNKKEIEFKDAMKMVIMYFILACVFCAGIYFFMDKKQGLDFAMGYLVELSLSVDNVFVFALIFTHFAVPREYQYRVLFWGIIVAVILRFIFIYTGIELIKQFEWILYVFGAFLIFTGIKMIKASGDEPDVENNIVLRIARKKLRLTEGYEGNKFIVKRNGLIYFTPLFVIMMVINFVDIVFAFDSIPAIFAITRDTFIVFTSNIFAIMGLRSMYFVLANVIQRFRYLKYGLSILLVFIGLKMVLNHAFHPRDIIPTDISLVVTIFIVGASIWYSLYRTRGEKPVEGSEKENILTGWVPGSPEENNNDKK